VAALNCAALSVTGIALPVDDVCAVLSVLSALSTLSGTVAVSPVEVVKAGVVSAKDSCLILVVLAVTVAEEAEVVVVVNLMPQTFSASKVKSRFLALHSVCCRSMDSTRFKLANSYIMRSLY
jgi:hypothetical protein